MVISVNQLWEKFRVYFEKIEPPAPTRLDGILAKLRRRRLIRYERNTNPAQHGEGQIEVLPTLQRVIPFDSLEAWLDEAERHRTANIRSEPTDDAA